MNANKSIVDKSVQPLSLLLVSKTVTDRRLERMKIQRMMRKSIECLKKSATTLR